MQFDYNRLLTATDGDEDLAKELMMILETQFVDQLTNAERAVAEGDCRQLHLAIHTLRAPLATIGATPALELAQALEALANSSDLLNAHTLLGKLRKELEQLTADFATIRGVVTT